MEPMVVIPEGMDCRDFDTACRFHWLLFAARIIWREQFDPNRYDDFYVSKGFAGKTQVE